MLGKENFLNKNQQSLMGAHTNNELNTVDTPVG